MEEKMSEEKMLMSAAQRRAETRRRKLLLNSEERLNRIVGFTKSESDVGSSRRSTEPRFHLDLDRTDSWSAKSSQRPSPFLQEGPLGTPEARHSPLPECVDEGVRPRPRGGGGAEDGSPRRGLQKYLSRLDDAMKLRGQLANEKPAPDAASEAEELDPFRVFRLVCSVLLAVLVQVFVCKYLSIFAPFLTLELAFMGLSKYFPKVERKPQTTVLTTALLLSGIPAEVINRSMDTYRRMGDVFADLCLYFFTFIITHEVLLLVSSEAA